MSLLKNHLIAGNRNIKEALNQLNQLAIDAILFVVDNEGRLQGSLTDGDVRRGFLKGCNFENPVNDFIQPNPKFIRKDDYSIETLIDYRNKNFRIIPVLDSEGRIIKIINFRSQKSYLPVDAVIMAGGRGERLRPLTDEIPKPLLEIGGTPIIEHNIDRLISFGIDNVWLSVRYLGEKIQNYFGEVSPKDVRIQYVWENEPLGTIGAVSTIKNLSHDFVLITNSDILTNVDYEDFFLSFLKSGADLSVVTIPYEVSVPYAVFETSNGHVMSFKEKPTYTYYSNGGIYLLKREIIDLIPNKTLFNATDLLERMIELGKKVHSYPLHGYWLDIGKMADFQKANQDINHIRF